jgi:hypothetical protein
VRERIKKEFRDLSVETTPLPTKQPAATRSKLKDQGPEPHEAPLHGLKPRPPAVAPSSTMQSRCFSVDSRNSAGSTRSSSLPDGPQASGEAQSQGVDSTTTASLRRGTQIADVIGLLDARS